MIDYDDELLFDAVQKFGFDKQTLMAVEEMSELQKELLKHVNRGADNRQEVKEELVDVLITLRQVFLIYDFMPKELNEVANKKMERLKRYINEKV